MQQTLTLLAGEMAVVSPEVAYLYRPAVPRVAGCLHEVCITTLAVLAFFWCSINNLRFQRLVDLYCSYLVEAAGRASAVNRDPINLNVLQFTLRIQYSNVSGWAGAMAGMHSQIAKSFKNIWGELLQKGMLNSGFDDPLHSVQDIIMFGVLYCREIGSFKDWSYHRRCFETRTGIAIIE